MKFRNKFLALLLAATMSFSVSACGSADAGKDDGKPATEDTADDGSSEDVDCYAAAVEKMKDVSSMNAEMHMNMDMSVEANGQTQDMKMVTTSKMSCMYHPMLLKMDMNMDVGDGTAINMSAYAEEADDGTYTMYMNDGTQWVSQNVELDDLAQYDAASNLTGYMQESYNFQDAGTEQLDGKSVRKYTGTITGDDMKETIMATGALNSVGSAGLDESDLDALFKDLGELPINLWIDETDLYPVKYEMDMTDMMNSLMSNLTESMGDEAEGASITVSNVKLEMTCSDFNAVSEFSIPDEAKAAAPAA